MLFRRAAYNAIREAMQSAGIDSSRINRLLNSHDENQPLRDAHRKAVAAIEEFLGAAVECKS